MTVGREDCVDVWDRGGPLDSDCVGWEGCVDAWDRGGPWDNDCNCGCCEGLVAAVDVCATPLF